MVARGASGARRGPPSGGPSSAVGAGGQLRRTPNVPQGSTSSGIHFSRPAGGAFGPGGTPVRGAFSESSAHGPRSACGPWHGLAGRPLAPLVLLRWRRRSLGLRRGPRPGCTGAGPDGIGCGCGRCGARSGCTGASGHTSRSGVGGLCRHALGGGALSSEDPSSHDPHVGKGSAEAPYRRWLARRRSGPVAGACRSPP